MDWRKIARAGIDEEGGELVEVGRVDGDGQGAAETGGLGLIEVVGEAGSRGSVGGCSGI